MGELYNESEINFQNEIVSESEKIGTSFQRIHHLSKLCIETLLDYCSELERNSEIGTQYLHDLVEEKFIMTNIDLQKSIADSEKRLANLTSTLVKSGERVEKLTRWLVFLTLVLAVLTGFLIIFELLNYLV